MVLRRLTYLVDEVLLDRNRINEGISLRLCLQVMKQVFELRHEVDYIRLYAIFIGLFCDKIAD